MKPGPEPRRREVRCAIYTRKSSEEGLEQDFNSLDAQREACAAYILSQASEGWSLTAERYDDGGISGGTLERPALQRLLADVAERRIDIIVVYKVDRLTRSLLDFSKLVEAFDAADTSFFSVTQSFNTTTSMGRLTLNMLLSFAQFEREVTAERIRDKIAASKAKGMWMEGTPPLGYRPDGRSLAIVDEHAALIRHIFTRYLALGNVRLLEAELRNDGIRVPARTTTNGKPLGGGWFSRGLLHAILRRIVYDGRIAHGDTSYPGTHPPLIAHDMFEQVQALLASGVKGQRRAPRTAEASLLAGRIVDAAGEPLIATHACKAGSQGRARYRYYVSRSLHLKTDDIGMRIPAREIETLVTARLASLFADLVALVATLWLDVPAHRYPHLHERCAEIATGTTARMTLAGFVEQVQVHDAPIDIRCSTGAIAAALDLSLHADAPAIITLASDARLTRSGRAMRLVHDNGSTASTHADEAFHRLLPLARRWWTELRAGELDVTRLAEREGVSASWVTRVVRLAFLSPAVVDAALAGQLRGGVDATRLMLGDHFPASWREQEAALLAG